MEKNFLEIVNRAEILLDDENQPTNGDFERALKNALKGTPYEDRVWGDFYFEDDDVEATYVIFIDGKPAYTAGTCHLAGYPGNKHTGIHSGYYYGISAINEGDAENKYLPCYDSYRQEDEVMFK
jgi:hypothetical protein